ncbi:MAG: hypothetical protein HY293_21980 [Planctomycetes bacterium]|nr:hypothetical protein [Planctomycetota bacterium]
MAMHLMAILLGFPQDKADEEAAGAVTACEQAFLKSKDTSARVEAIGSMSQTKHEKVIAKLATYLTNEDKAVKAAAVAGLASFQEASVELKRLASKTLATSMAAGANVKDVDFKAAVLASLGTLQEDNAVTTIKTMLDDKDLKVATAAVNACVAMRAKTLVEALIDQLKECDKTFKSGANGPAITGKRPVSARKSPDAPPDPEEVKRDRAANLVITIPTALQTLTNQQLTSAADWSAWWAKNRTTFTISK